jgi:hypothetical protein
VERCIVFASAQEPGPLPTHNVSRQERESLNIVRVFLDLLWIEIKPGKEFPIVRNVLARVLQYGTQFPCRYALAILKRQSDVPFEYAHFGADVSAREPFEQGVKRIREEEPVDHRQASASHWRW